MPLRGSCTVGHLLGRYGDHARLATCSAPCGDHARLATGSAAAVIMHGCSPSSVQ
jgi:hypothetical protein